MEEKEKKKRLVSEDRYRLIDVELSDRRTWSGPMPFNSTRCSVPVACRISFLICVRSESSYLGI